MTTIHQNIGIIGYGKLGRAIGDRAREIGKTVITGDKSENVKIAQEADTLVISVKPAKVFEVADEIRGRIRSTHVVSLMAAVPSEKLQLAFGIRVERAMTNLGLDAIQTTNGDRVITDLCRHLTKGQLIETDADEKADERIDLFTSAVGCLPGIAAWWFLNHAHEADTWLGAWSAHLHETLSLNETMLANIITGVKEGGDYASMITRVKTPGGITEAMLKVLEQDTKIDMAHLMNAAMNRTREIAASICNRTP